MTGRVRKPRTRWLGIISNLRPSEDLIPTPVVVMWSLAAELDADAALTAWWNQAPHQRLELRPTPFTSRPGFHAAGRHLLVQQRSEAEVALRRTGGLDWCEADPADVPDWFRPLLRDDVHRMLEAVGTRLGIGRPPLPPLRPAAGSRATGPQR